MVSIDQAITVYWHICIILSSERCTDNVVGSQLFIKQLVRTHTDTSTSIMENEGMHALYFLTERELATFLQT